MSSLDQFKGKFSTSRQEIQGVAREGLKSGMNKATDLSRTFSRSERLGERLSCIAYGVGIDGLKAMYADISEEVNGSLTVVNG